MSDTPATGIALLVVDVQPTFLKAMPEGEACLRRCVLAASAAKLLGVPVLFTEQVPAKLGPTHPDLLLASGEGRAVFGKTAFSAFGAPGLVEAFGKMQVSQLLICGLEIPVCVYQTAMDALREGMGVTILSDAVGKPAVRKTPVPASRRSGRRGRISCRPRRSFTRWLAMRRTRSSAHSPNSSSRPLRPGRRSD
jgi:nicotinamidase-related amidase